LEYFPEDSDSVREIVASGVIDDPVYMPLFCFASAAIFWIVVAALTIADLQTLSRKGWLFATKTEPSTSSAGWNYWALFDLSRIRWSELPPVAGDLALLVAIATLSLPVFTLATVAELTASEDHKPSKVTELDVSKHDMNQEFFGHGLANVFAARFGTLPALMVFVKKLHIAMSDME
jgi:MFS superfamily sulfate permease-like transporter